MDEEKRQQLLTLNKEGFLPLDGESIEAFTLRIKALRSFSQKKEILEQLNLKGARWATPEEVESLMEGTKDLFGFRFRFPYLLISNKRLPVWVPAMTWIAEKEGMKFPLIQLGPWKKMGPFTKEVAAHEALHAFRHALSEDRFEELLAYHTSKRAWRRRISPLFASNFEAIFCALSLGISFLVGLFFSWYGGAALAFATLVFFSARLILAHRVLDRAKRMLLELAPQVSPLWILCRLSDREIVEAAKSSPQQFFSWIKENQVSNLRLKAIYEAYFS